MTTNGGCFCGCLSCVASIICLPWWRFRFLHLKKISVGLSASLSFSMLPKKTLKTPLWKNTILSWLSLAKINNITSLDNTHSMSRSLNLHHLDSFASLLLTRSIFSSWLCTFNAWKTELSGFRNLAFSCLATTVLAACQLKSDHTVSILLSSGGMKRKKESLVLDVTVQSPW